jgi:hypothetical protein
MARRMWGNDEKVVYRSIVTVTYPQGWRYYGNPADATTTEVTFHGPFLASGPARAAVTRLKRQIRNLWQFQAKRTIGLPMPIVESVVESAELNWKPVED